MSARDEKLEAWLLAHLNEIAEQPSNHRVVYTLMWDADKAGILDANHPKSRATTVKALNALRKRGLVDRTFSPWGEAFELTEKARASTVGGAT